MLKKNIKATNIKLSPDVSKYLDEKVSHIERLVDDSDTSAEAQIELAKTTKHHRSGDIYRAEMNLHIAGKNFRAESERADIFSAIDEMKDDMMVRLRRHKDRKVGLVRRGGLKVKKMLRRIYRR